MDQVSALSVMMAPQGRAGPGTWGQAQDGGFVDFITAVMNRSETPAVRAGQMKNAEPAAAMWTAPRAAIIDKDVESVVPPQLVDSREDLIQLIALLLGEEENDGFLCALEQYILQKPEFLTIVQTITVRTDHETKLFDLLFLLPVLLRGIKEDDLPPELAPLANLLILFQPEAPPAEAVPAEQPVSGEEILIKAETQAETVKAETLPLEETEEAPPPVVAREIQDTVRVTEIKIAPRHRVTYNPFSALRAVSPVQTLEITKQTLKSAETLEMVEEPVVWDLAEEETQLTEKVELSFEEEPFDTTAGETNTETAAVPQQPVQPVQAAKIQQTAETAPVRQIAAERIIDQITAQAAKADVSMIQMELNPKFLGRIHLVIEASAGGMIARLRSDNGAVRSLLGEHIVELKASLKEAGINMKDIEITESRVSTQLSDRRFQQNTAEQAGEQQTKIKGLPSITAADQTEDAEPAITAYATGRVSGDSQFDYRA